MRAARLLGFAAVLCFGATGARADEKADAILREAFRTLHASQSMAATFSCTIKNGNSAPDVYRGTVALKKPNFARIEMTGQASMLLVADGKSYYILQGDSYLKEGLAAKPTHLDGLWGGEIDAFFGGEALAETGRATLLPSEKVDGADCHIVKVHKNLADSVVYAIGKNDHLIRRAVTMDASHEGPPNTVTNRLTDIRLNVALPADRFQVSLPQGAKSMSERQEAGLLPVGQNAPNFTLPTPDGGQVALGEALKGKKALLVNFWFYH